jgi:predicted regulator of Ras-like GTPase activity (Roadblock/LC7/MglB family)
LSSEDGTPLISLGKAGQDAATLGQTAAAIFRGTRQSVQRLSQGRMNQVLITAEAGQILLVETAKGVLVVLADEKIKIGLFRLALDAAVKKVEKIFLA